MIDRNAEGWDMLMGEPTGGGTEWADQSDLIHPAVASRFLHHIEKCPSGHWPLSRGTLVHIPMQRRDMEMLLYNLTRP